MDDVLLRALAPVLRDLRSAGVPARLEDHDWADDPGMSSALVYGTDGSGQGIHVSRSGSDADRITAIADQLHDWAIEQLWPAAASNWPPCLRHPDTHPLQPALIRGAPWWQCPRSQEPIYPIGAAPLLPPRR